MDRPNIVFVMADDMGWGDVGCYGAEKIPTPHIDRIAANGVRFMDAHSSAAVCTPSRYSVLTGRYCWRTRLQQWVLRGFGAPLIELNRLTVAQLLKQHGYATGAVGKWHLGLGWTARPGEPFSPDDPQETGFAVDYTAAITGGPTELGFDWWFGTSASLDMPPYCFIENDHTVGVPSAEKQWYGPQQVRGLMVEDWRDEQVDVTFARQAVGFIERNCRKRPNRPFFLYVPLSAPHRPCLPPDFMKGRSQAGPRGDMVCVVDWVVGQITSALEREGVLENTLLIVTSDNGARATCFDGNDYGHRANGPWRGQKADIWDGGHREPFVAQWPARIGTGRMCDDLICLADLMATCADMLGAELPVDAGPDSISFLSALLGKSQSPRQVLVHHSGGGMFSVRRRPWKAVFGLGSGGFSEPQSGTVQLGEPEGQLYNLEEDPAETDNLWNECPAVVAELRELLELHRRQGRSRAL